MFGHAAKVFGKGNSCCRAAWNSFNLVNKIFFLDVVVARNHS